MKPILKTPITKRSHISPLNMTVYRPKKTEGTNIDIIRLIDLITSENIKALGNVTWPPTVFNDILKINPLMRISSIVPIKNEGIKYSSGIKPK